MQSVCMIAQLCNLNTAQINTGGIKMDECKKGKDRIREEVSANYARAITERNKNNNGCCGGNTSSCCCRSHEKGYNTEDLKDLPFHLANISFGCGNPLAYSEIEEGDTILDLGSGAGLDLLIAARRVGPSGKVIGVDMTDEMIAVARAHILASGLMNVEVRKGLIEELPVDDSSVDWVISNCVINLSPEKDRIFSEISRVLKSGGKMLISDIVAEELPEWIRNSESLYCSCIGGAISEEEYLCGLENSGLVDLEIRASATYGEEEIKGYVNISNEVPPLIRIDGKEMNRNEAAEHYSAKLSGKIRSIQVYGRKP